MSQLHWIVPFFPPGPKRLKICYTTFFVCFCFFFFVLFCATLNCGLKLTAQHTESDLEPKSEVIHCPALWDTATGWNLRFADSFEEGWGRTKDPSSFSQNDLTIKTNSGARSKWTETPIFQFLCTLEYIWSGADSSSGLKSVFFCSVLRMCLIQPVIADKVLQNTKRNISNIPLCEQFHVLTLKSRKSVQGRMGLIFLRLVFKQSLWLWPHFCSFENSLDKGASFVCRMSICFFKITFHVRNIFPQTELPILEGLLSIPLFNKTDNWFTELMSIKTETHLAIQTWNALLNCTLGKFIVSETWSLDVGLDFSLDANQSLSF